MIEEDVKLGNFLCRMIYNKKQGMPIIFLHGYFFTSDVWYKIDILDLLEEKEIPFVAIDMPYGVKSRCNPKTSNPEPNVRIVEEVVGDAKPIIVGASLGGYIALKYSIKNPVKGLFLIAPVRSLEEELIRDYKRLGAHIFIVYGERDEIVSLDEMKELSTLLNAELLVYENASHPAYLDKPSRFKEDLLKLYSIVS